MAIRKKQEPDEYQKALRKFHKKSNRHVVVFEADISEDEKRRIFSDADHLPVNKGIVYVFSFIYCDYRTYHTYHKSYRIKHCENIKDHKYK